MNCGANLEYFIKSLGHRFHKETPFAKTVVVQNV
jgi:hypothetical protein